MKYLINITMIYDSVAGTLRANNEEDEGYVRLSKQASRLLHELIRHHQQVLERNYLIWKVWEENGGTGSSMSLNVAISEIRRAFRQLNSDPMLIQTLRSVGFTLLASVEPLEMECAVNRVEDRIPSPNPASAVELKISNREWMRNASRLLAGYLLVTAFIAGLAINEIKWSSLPDVDASLNPTRDLIRCPAQN